MTAASSPPSQISLRPGETAQVELPGLGTSGFRWSHTVMGPDGVVEIESRPGAVAAVPGRNAAHLVTIRAVRAGNVTLRLRQARSWEPTKPPVRSHDISVVVQDA